MYKKSESNVILDDIECDMTPPQTSIKVVNNENVIQGHAIFRDNSIKVTNSPPSTNSKGGKANNIRTKLLKNMI